MGRTKADWQRARSTFRHGNLPEALVAAALERLETEGAAGLSLRELARDAGVNHRAVYRHFPDKLALLARVAEEGWRRLARDMEKDAIAENCGEEALVAGGWAFYRFSRANPHLIELMAGPRINEQGAFPDLERAITAVLASFVRGFVEFGTPQEVALLRTVFYVAALRGITDQVIYKRLRVAPNKAAGFVGDICQMLIKGLR
ncbi:MAG: TetR/AcrR family transcriptional regulator [Alphaproteobacteria bacterium]